MRKSLDISFDWATESIFQGFKIVQISHGKRTQICFFFFIIIIIIIIIFLFQRKLSLVLYTNVGLVC